MFVWKVTQFSPDYPVLFLRRQWTLQHITITQSVFIGLNVKNISFRIILDCWVWTRFSYFHREVFCIFNKKLTLIVFEKNSQKTKTAHPYNLNGQMRKNSKLGRRQCNIYEYDELPRCTVFCFLILYLWYYQQLLLTCNDLFRESPKPCWSKTDMKVRSKHMNGCSVLGVSHAAEWKLAIYNLKWTFINYINL
jgi:hypothetical protein